MHLSMSQTAMSNCLAEVTAALNSREILQESIKFPVNAEQRQLVMRRDDGRRPDGATLVPWSLGRTLVWDAMCVDTLAPSHIQSTSIRAGAAAEQAQLLKRRKYTSISQDYEFAALAVETVGPWSTECKKTFKDLSTRLIHASGGDLRAGAYFSQRLSLVI